ncbi:MAG: S8 family serine peptidase [Ekhidna sp.]
MTLLLNLFQQNALLAQKIETVRMVEDNEKVLPDQYYLVKNLPLKEKVLLRDGDSGVMKGRDIVEGVGSIYEVSNEWKLSGDLKMSEQKRGVFYVKLYDTNKGLSKSNNDIVLKHIGSNLISIRVRSKESFRSLLEDLNVIFIQNSERKPKVETLIRQHDLGANGISLSHHLYPELNGSDLAVSVKENAYDSSDIDIARRSFRDVFSSPTVELHATEMATLIGGNGSSYLSGKGVSEKLKMYSTDFSSLLPESESYYSSRNISVQNHSYGVQIENFYGVESEAFDELTKSNKELLHVFSIGNSGLMNGTGNYEDIESYGTITGSFKQAKNVLLISSTDSLGGISDFNSRGPAYDGRIKPDLVAFGGEGTSEAAALVSGAATLIQDRCLENEGSMPSSELVRALLIAGAEDMYDPGPDFVSGYGELDLFNSLQMIDSSWFFTHEISNNVPSEVSVSIPANTSKANFVLTWNDEAANPGETISLVNDLDLVIKKNGKEWLPWVLDSRPTLRALESEATKGRDHLNNTEMVTVDNPEAGSYTLTVNPFGDVLQQSFSIAYSFENTNSFQWMYPTGSDPLKGNSSERFHWRTNISGESPLEINYLDENWHELLPQVDLENGQVSVQLPDTTSLFKLRIGSNGTFHESDTILVNKTVDLKVDLNCVSDLILKWDNADVLEYSVRTFSDGQIEELSVTTDTFLIIDRSIYSGQFFSVLPKTVSKSGNPSFLINVDQQGTGCFNNNFLATLSNDGFVDLKVELSGVSQISEASILKSTRGQQFEIFESWSPESEEISFQDMDLENGIITYQLRIRTLSGQDYYSAIEEISITDTYFAAPNVISDQFFNWFSPQAGGILQLSDHAGRVVAEYDIVNEIEEIEVAGLTPGQYYFRVVKSGSILSKGKLIIQ